MKSRAVKRHVAGVQGQESGQDFEQALSQSHEAYLAGGLAWIDQLPVPTVPVRGELAQSIAARLGAARLGGLRQLSRRQGYDFFGHFGPEAGPPTDPGAWHGLAIAMEAKRSTEQTTSLPIASPRMEKGHIAYGTGLRDTQLDALVAAYMDFGVVSAVVWRNGNQGLVLLPDAIHAAWAAFHAGGRKSIPVSQFQPYDVVDYPRTFNVHDWLFPVRCWLEKNGRPSPALSQRKTYHMLNFRIDYHAQQVVAKRQDGSEVSSGTQMSPRLINERHLLEKLARECTDADAFIDKVNSFEAADEARG